MFESADRMKEAEFRRLARVKAAAHPRAEPLGDVLVGFFKQSVQKRQTKLSQVSQIFVQLVPPMLVRHCCLKTFSKGVLTVLVDDSAHLYEMKQLLLAGLERQIVLASRGAGLKKIALRAGQW